VTTATIDRTELADRALVALRALVGRSDAAFHDGQWEAIEALVADRRRALVVQRTGWGKSAVYFVATTLLRAAGAGPTVIVSPLLALMRNQVSAAARAGVNAVTVNSANVEDWADIHRRIAAGEVDVLLVSPERLNNPEFRDEVLPRLAATTGLLVIDEAHCISDWGHDFRPDYRRIRSLLRELPPGIPVLATTATANSRVVDDIAEQLSAARNASMDEVLVLRGTLDRDSLRLGVLTLPRQADRLAWLADHLAGLPGSGIVYCLTVAATEQVADFLRGRGLPVVAYSGKTDPAERLAAEDDLLANQVKAVIATSALGMGFDKPDLGFVVHLGSPPSPIAYYQQVGRAGRGLARAEVVLLPAPEDQDIWNWFGEQAFPAEDMVRDTLAALADAGRPLSTAALEAYVPLRRGRLETMLKVLDTDGAARRVKGGWVATGLPWTYDTERYARVRQTRLAEQRSMLDYQRTDGCRMRFLRMVLDDPDTAAGSCGRCDNCGGLSLPAQVRAETTAATDRALGMPGVQLEVRRMWPPGRVVDGRSGKLRAEETAEPGRAVARLTDLGWGGALRRLFDPRTPDGELPVPLRHAVVEVLRGWPGGLSVDAIAVVGSDSRPQLVGHLAAGLARYLDLPMVAQLEPRPDRPRCDRSVNSAQRLRQVHDRFTVRTLGPGPVGHRVLLVDDVVGSGWTMTVAARMLRLAGATAVVPLALAVEQ
jgi:ATP-dependent DNA helicase RecQ